MISPPISVPVVTIDGPSGAGKGTVAQAAAAKLGWNYLESGALYRVLGLLAARNNVALDDVDGLVKLAGNLDLSFINGAVLLGDEQLDAEIRTEQAGRRASKIAPIAKVRVALMDWQRRMAKMPGLIADGRDMGSVVFPQAPCKIYLTASADARAKRRYQQLINNGFSVDMAEILQEITARDKRDLTRPISPLTCAADAIKIDNTELSISQTIAAVIKCINQTKF